MVFIPWFIGTLAFVKRLAGSHIPAFSESFGIQCPGVLCLSRLPQCVISFHLIILVANFGPVSNSYILVAIVVRHISAWKSAYYLKCTDLCSLGLVRILSTRYVVFSPCQCVGSSIMCPSGFGLATMSEAFKIVIFANFIPVTVRQICSSFLLIFSIAFIVGLRDLVILLSRLRSYHCRCPSHILAPPQDRNR
jgi:hypothetical protein